ncbi:hypothetical protein MMC31_002441 [Peltigera leucophlebia]|nr:hypothetical protein [Peltigera leucophlebia]
MRELRPFKLPQLVEDRVNENKIDTSESAPTGHGLYLSTSSTPSEEVSSAPTTPTISVRVHSRFPSSSSSLASSPTMRESIDGFGSQKTPLSDVKEEPLEREEGFQMAESLSIISKGHDFMTALDTSFRYGENYESSSPNDYDLADESQLDCESTWNLALKRNRASDSSINNLTSRFGTRLPSLSRKWRHKRAGNPTAIDDFSPEPKLSRANSTRAPSLAGSCIEAMEPQDHQLPPTPARSTFDDEAGDSSFSGIDIKKANAPRKSEDHEVKASTPLLPPIMVQLPLHIKDVPFQSPLQSPTIAQSPTTADYESALSFNSSGNTMQHPGLPSPPLSTRPSISSFQRGLSQLLPTSEIPSMLSNDPCDEWSNRLGHANFTIHPEPYLPESFDVTACKRLRSDWDLARCNYLKHLARIGEHYGATSKIFRLTEEKWAGIDTLWRRNTELSISRTVENGYEAELSRSQSSIAEPTPIMKLPALNGPRSEGKFPELGDEAIVGPMEQVASQLQRRPSRKVGFFKFIQGVMPSTGSFARSVRSRSVSP